MSTPVNESVRNSLNFEEKLINLVAETFGRGPYTLEQLAEITGALFTVAARVYVRCGAPPDLGITIFRQMHELYCRADSEPPL